METQFSRNEIIIGKEKQEIISNKTVAIFGIGGVGSYTIESLARCGIQNLILIDNDTVSISNINRQLIALHSTVGKLKTEVMKARLLDINPNINIITYNKFIENGNSRQILLDNKIDYIVDAIDTVPSKLELIKFANELNIPIISSMGTGNKLRPDLLELTDISKTSVCPLAKKIRKELKNLKIPKLNVVYSKESPNKTIETTTIGSISFVPSVAGLLITSKIIILLSFFLSGIIKPPVIRHH